MATRHNNDTEPIRFAGVRQPYNPWYEYERRKAALYQQWISGAITFTQYNDNLQQLAREF